MPKSRTRRKPARRTASLRAVPLPPLYGPRQLRALALLADPLPLDPVLDADAPDRDAPMPPDAVRTTWEGTRDVLMGLGREDLLACPVAAGLRQAAENGTGLLVPPHAAKALWRFCDAFAAFEPRLARSAEGLRVIVAV